VKGLVITKQEERVNNIKWRRRVFEFPKDGSTINVVQENVELVWLIREPPVVNKDVLYSLADLFFLATWMGVPGSFSSVLDGAKTG
jgi:hypothetical protein